jgi:hypothetical protein
MVRVVRDLVDNQDFDCSTNPWTLPTIGAHAQGSAFDPNPQARWAPQFRQKYIGEAAGDIPFPPKKPKKANPLAAKKEKAQNALPGMGQEDIQNVLAQQGGLEQQAAQQGIDAQQQGMMPPGDVNAQDAMQGMNPQDAMQPQLPELPRDLRKDPSWEGNRAAKISAGLQTYSQKLTNRYEMEQDPMLSNPGPRTFSHRMRMQQVRSGDVRNRRPTNNGETV